MKTVIALTCLLFAIVAAQDAAETLHKAHQQCQSNPATHISDEDGAKLVHGEPLPKSVYGPYVICVSNNLRTQKPNGEADVDAIRKYLAGILEGKVDAQKFLEQCNVQKGESVETARAIYICFHNALTEAGKHP